MKSVVRPAVNSLLPACVALALALLCASCVSKTKKTPPPAPMARLQPIRTLPAASSGNMAGTQGFLVVATPSELHFDESNARRFPHTGYTIYTASGRQMIQYIPNHTGRAGETATTVMLPAGLYMVEARTAWHLPVRFQVVIRPQTLTTVNLEGDLTPPKTIHGQFYAVQFRGRTIGWATEVSALN